MDGLFGGLPLLKPICLMGEFMTGLSGVLCCGISLSHSAAGKDRREDLSSSTTGPRGDTSCVKFCVYIIRLESNNLRRTKHKQWEGDGNGG